MAKTDIIHCIMGYSRKADMLDELKGIV
jgi:hypothetical protein